MITYDVAVAACLISIVVSMIVTWRVVRVKTQPLGAPLPPPPSASQRKMMGFDSPADQKVPVRVGDWNAMKLAAWRSKRALEIAARASAEIVERCEHVDKCPGKDDEHQPCIGPRLVFEDPPPPEATEVTGCPDREIRMSALVALNAARTFATIDATQPAQGPYFAPSREYFSEILAELGATQVELDRYRRRYGPLQTFPSDLPSSESLEETAA